MYGESKSVATQTFQTLPDGVIQQCPHTAVTRVPKAVVNVAKRDVLRHLMPVVPVRRSADDPRADLVVYMRCEDQGGYVYVHSLDDKRMAGEPISAPKGYCRETECKAEAEAAAELVDPVMVRRALVTASGEPVEPEEEDGERFDGQSVHGSR